jgi:hypothetical protein
MGELAMKPWPLAVAALLCGALVTPATHAAQDHHHHDPAASAAVPAAPVPATRYTPDAPLRAGMRSVHQAVSELAHAEMGHMSAAMTRDRATAIETAVAGMFANCKLEPTPDAALHGILVPLLTAAQALKANPADTAQVVRMRDAIAAYPRYFDDTGWDAPAASDEP